MDNVGLNWQTCIVGLYQQLSIALYVMLGIILGLHIHVHSYTEAYRPTCVTAYEDLYDVFNFCLPTAIC